MVPVFVISPGDDSIAKVAPHPPDVSRMVPALVNAPAAASTVLYEQPSPSTVTVAVAGTLPDSVEFWWAVNRLLPRARRRGTSASS